MKPKLLMVALLLVTACEGGSKPIDPAKYLNALDGPKVPTLQETLIESAKTAEKKGDYKQAAQFYQQALEKHRDDREVALALAEALRRCGENDDAILVYDSLLAKDAGNLPAKEGKALALLAKGDYTTSSMLLEEVLKVDKTRWKSLNAMGILATTHGMHDDAQHYFDDALKYNPDSATVLNNLGLSQALGGSYAPAVASLTKASSLATPGSSERKRIDFNTALVYAISGRLEDANAIATTYLTGAELNNNLGLYAHLAKDDQMAKSYLNMALTESKVFYEKAWDNLQYISGDNSAGESPSAASDASVKPLIQHYEETPAAKPGPGK